MADPGLSVGPRFSRIVATGLGAAAVGWVAEAYDLFGPTYVSETWSTSGARASSTHSLVQMGIDPRAAAFLLVVSLVLACVPIGALLAWRGRRAAGLAVLVPAVALLVVATVLTALSIGWTLLPADVVAGVVLLMAARQRSAPLDQPSSTSM